MTNIPSLVVNNNYSRAVLDVEIKRLGKPQLFCVNAI